MPDSAPRRTHTLFGKILIGLSGVAWLAAVAVTVLMLVAFIAGELEGMVALSGIVIIVIAVAVAVLITGATLLHLYLARRRGRAR
ncbi:hypothetical protein [Catellatospora sp. NPDC049133]|jgi:hypothetical protein|uniref:hypothetical protein n=1 Tax=Catellatospora sp. NPDC049133 TaxID=3155499 RepID=UPI0033E641D3